MVPVSSNSPRKLDAFKRLMSRANRQRSKTRHTQSSLPSSASSPHPRTSTTRTSSSNSVLSSLHAARMTSTVATGTPNPSMDRFLKFYHPRIKGQDNRGRTLDDILGWNDEMLERVHNYIQIMFPLPESSMFNFSVPVIDEETMLCFTQSHELKKNLLRSLKRMLSFYGFDAADRGEEADYRLTITPKADCERGFSHWVNLGNHNHLRITRIIRSLRVLGLGAAANDFYDALMKVCETNRVSPSSIDYWGRAMKDPLQYAPDGTEVDWLALY